MIKTQKTGIEGNFLKNKKHLQTLNADIILTDVMKECFPWGWGTRQECPLPPGLPTKSWRPERTLLHELLECCFRGVGDTEARWKRWAKGWKWFIKGVWNDDPGKITGQLYFLSSTSSKLTPVRLSVDPSPPTLEKHQFSSVAQSYPTLCDPRSCSTPGLPVHHQLPEPVQTHVHRVGDAIQPPHPLSSPSPPAFNLSQHQGLFQWVSPSHQVARLLEFHLQHQSFQWTPRTDLL